jgi:hypothetical protein
MSLPVKLEILTQLIEQHTFINLDWGPGFTYKRARPIPPEQVLTSYTESLWPSADRASAGRANSEGKAVMYLADTSETAFSEIRLSGGHVLLSQFQIRSGVSFRLLPLGERFLASTSRGGLLLRGEPLQMLRNAINEQDFDECRRDIIIDSFLHQTLCADVHPYEISSHICSEIFRFRPYISGIAYPSMRRPGSVNFAVQTESFWTFWGIFSVSRFDTTPLAQGFFEISNRANVERIDTDGTLVWSSDKPEPRCTYGLNALWTPNA